MKKYSPMSGQRVKSARRTCFSLFFVTIHQETDLTLHWKTTKSSVSYAPATKNTKHQQDSLILPFGRWRAATFHSRPGERFTYILYIHLIFFIRVYVYINIYMYVRIYLYLMWCYIRSSIFGSIFKANLKPEAFWTPPSPPSSPLAASRAKAPSPTEGPKIPEV